MLYSLTTGIVFGLSAGWAPGPLLTLVITHTLKHGVGEGIKIALAPLITDFPIILVSFYFLTRLKDFHHVLALISLAGGFYVLYLAYTGFRTELVNLDTTESRPQSLKQGSLANALNPHPYLFWITVGTPFMLECGKNNPLAALVFVLSFYLLLVGSKVFLALLVGKWRAFLTGKAYGAVMRALACLLAFLALLLFKDAWTLLGEGNE